MEVYPCQSPVKRIIGLRILHFLGLMLLNLNTVSKCLLLVDIKIKAGDDFPSGECMGAGDVFRGITMPPHCNLLEMACQSAASYRRQAVCPSAMSPPD